MPNSGAAYYYTSYERPELLIGGDRATQTAVLMRWHDQLHQLACGERLIVSDTSTGRICVGVELHGATRWRAERDMAALDPLMHAYGWNKATGSGRETKALTRILPDALKSRSIIWLNPGSGDPAEPA